MIKTVFSTNISPRWGDGGVNIVFLPTFHPDGLMVASTLFFYRHFTPMG
jgi:hypothetical protein